MTGTCFPAPTVGLTSTVTPDSGDHTPYSDIHAHLHAHVNAHNIKKKRISRVALQRERVQMANPKMAHFSSGSLILGSAHLYMHSMNIYGVLPMRPGRVLIVVIGALGTLMPLLSFRLTMIGRRSQTFINKQTQKPRPGRKAQLPKRPRGRVLGGGGHGRPF